MHSKITKLFITVIFLVISVVTDYGEYKIKNKHVLCFSALGLVLNGIVGGIHGLMDSFFGMLAPLMLLPLFAIRMLGAGDIKALCAVGSIMGLKISVFTVLFSFMSGGIIALVFMLFRRNSMERMKQFGLYLGQCFYMRKILSYEQFADEKSKFRFSFGILCGFAAIVFLGYV